MRRKCLAVLGAAALFLATACGGGEGASSSGEGPDKVTVGVIPIVDVAPIHLGIKQGFFSERDIKVNLESGQGGAAIVPGVVSGQFDFGFSNVTSLLLASSKGLPLKLVAAGNYSTGEQGHDFSGVVVPKGSDVSSAAGLSGKTVAVNTLKNIGDTTVRQSVEKAGGDPKKVKFVELPFPEMPAALANGQVDAAWLVEPFLTIAKNQGAKVVASNLVDTQKNLMIAAYFTSKQTIKSSPDLVKRFTAAMNESLKYAAKHPGQARSILQAYTKIDPKVAEELVLPKWSTSINESTLKLIARLAYEDGLVNKPIDYKALLRGQSG